MIEDHNSTNGIFVNGLKVKRQVLYTGDRVKVGPVEIYIQKGSTPTTQDGA
jgi:pSer/pThr/pTyr-binding forkhead associated (FHA) protein